MCWCSKAPESFRISNSSQWYSSKNQRNPSTAVSAPGHGYHSHTAGAADECGDWVVKPCPAPRLCLCSVGAGAADGRSARAASASALSFPAVEALNRRCASSVMEN